MHATPTAPVSSADATRRSTLDRLGIWSSLLCALHCIAAPFLLLLPPAAGSVWAHPAVHGVNVIPALRF